jgi:Transcriptional regulator, AbiEi antitoxin
VPAAIVGDVAPVNNCPPARLRELSGLQGRVVSRGQALAAGMSPDAIAWNLRSGTWQRIHPGVYALFTGQPGRAARLWAALLHAGAGAVLSHETAAELIGLANQASRFIHVTVPNTRRVIPPRGVVIHISRRPIPKWRYARGIPPHTMTEDTVIDLVNAAQDLDQVVGWVTTAFARHLTGEWPLRRAVADRSRIRWRRQLDEMITFAADGTHSVLEFRYDRDVERAHGLPRAARQAPFTKLDGSRGFRDRYYERYGRLVIELDGKRYHPGENQHLDQARDNQAAATGGSTLRYDWSDVTRDPCRTAAQVYDALQERGYQGALQSCSPDCRARGGVQQRKLA